VNGIVANIQRYSLNDGDGIRTIVFLKGCPLRCEWCSNPETQLKEAQILLNEPACMGCGRCKEVCPESVYGGQGKEKCIMCFECVDNCPKGAVELVGRNMSVQEVLEEVEKDITFYKNSNGGMTLSGGEALFQPEFAKALLEEAKRRGIHCAIETTGCAPENTALEILSLCDQILFDVKHMDSEVHKQYTGVGNEQILSNLEKISQLFSERIIVRIPLIKGFNCTKENLGAVTEMCRRLNIKQIDLLPYHELGKGKYKKLDREYVFDGKTPNSDELKWAKKFVEQAGIRCRLKG